MTNPLLTIGSPSGRRVFVIAIFSIISAILLGVNSLPIKPDMELFGILKIGHLLVASLWLSYLWMRRHII